MYWYNNNYIKFFFFSSNSISTGKYPYIKKLLNGNYILLSHTNISFADETLQSQFNIIPLNNIYGEDSNSIKNIASTTVSQFKEIYEGYIIAILNQELFIFSSSGIHQVNITIPFIDPTNTCSVIPNKNSGNNYYFTIIYAQCSDGENNCNVLIFKKIIFNSNSKTISFSSQAQFCPTSHLSGNSAGKFYGTISCDIMESINEEKIACVYGNSGFLVTSIFDPESYSELAFQSTASGGNYFKSVVLPEKKEISIICKYDYNGLICLSYNITSNSFSQETKIIGGGCEDNSYSLIIEYFHETEQFIIGCRGYSTEFYISKGSSENNSINLEKNTK